MLESHPLIINSDCEHEWLRDDITIPEQITSITFAFIYFCLLTVSFYTNILIWRRISKLQQWFYIPIGLLLSTTIFTRLIYFLDPAASLFSSNHYTYLWSYRSYLTISSTSICAQYELY